MRIGEQVVAGEFVLAVDDGADAGPGDGVAEARRR